MTLEKNNFKKNFFIFLKKIKNLTKKTKLRIIFSCFIITLTIQVYFWLKTENIKPNLGLVPEVPTLGTIKAFSFGDEEFYFRLKGLRLQNAGDTFGRFSPLKDYDYKKLVAWFELLDKLDNKSNYIPSLAAYYYSMTQNKDDLIYIINYLEQFADQNPTDKWWWYYQAMTIASNLYGDKDLAIKMANKLRENSPLDAPLWTKQMLALLLADKGEDCEAVKVIFSIMSEYESADKKISENELNFMKFFIEQKVKELKEKKFDPRKCM